MYSFVALTFGAILLSVAAIYAIGNWKNANVTTTKGICFALTVVIGAYSFIKGAVDLLEEVDTTTGLVVIGVFVLLGVVVIERIYSHETKLEENEQ